jgi:hypothetical protein
LSTSIFTACHKDNQAMESDKAIYASDFSKFTLSDFQNYQGSFSSEKSMSYYDKIEAAKNGKETITVSQLSEIGNPNNEVELLVALLVSENFKKEEVLSLAGEETLKRQIADEKNTLNTRGLWYYRWDGTPGVYSFWWRTTYFQCEKVTAFTKSGACNSYSIYGKVQRACGSIDCNIPRCRF